MDRAVSNKQIRMVQSVVDVAGWVQIYLHPDRIGELGRNCRRGEENDFVRRQVAACPLRRKARSLHSLREAIK